MAKDTFIEPHQDAIANLIREWEPKEKITWKEVCKKTIKILGREPTRQALAKNTLISDTFHAKKLGLRFKPKASEPKPSSLAAAAKTIANLRAEKDTLARKNAELEERFVRWQYNAYKKGMRKKDLDELMPAIDRDVSVFDEDKKEK
jgi:hypothetical protein